MRFRYYLRGAGIGIIVTTVILMIAFHNYKPTLSADEIIEEAKKLGMIMPEEERDDYIKEESSEGQSTEEENTEDDSSEEEKETEGDSEAEIQSGGSSDEGTDDSVDEGIDDATEEDSSSSTMERTMVVLTISGGDTSKMVSEKLLALGVITDAADFDKWLCVTKGLGNNILCGQFQIPQDATYEEIAEIITSN